jgi:MFS family permease
MYFYSSMNLAVLPLLPHYVERFGLTTVQAGIVLAAYPVSVPFVSFACVLLVPRVGARRITLYSAVLMTGATVIFAWAPTALILTLARFVQGLASGSIWTASMSWVTDNAPAGRRGRESGIVMGMLSAGSVAGPGVGALAAVAGSGIAFGMVAAVSAVGVVLTWLAPAGRQVVVESDVWRSIRRGAAQPATQAAIAIAIVDLLAFGTVDLLAPIYLGSHGTSVTAIAASLAAGALLGAIVGPYAGRIVDRIGPATVGLWVSSCVLSVPVVFAFTPPNAVQLAVLIVSGPMFAVVGAAMFPLSTLGADAAGVSHVTVTAIMGACWAGGFTLVPVAIGVVADHTSDGTAYALIATLAIPVFAFVAQRVRHVVVVAAGS